MSIWDRNRELMMNHCPNLMYQWHVLFLQHIEMASMCGREKGK